MDLNTRTLATRQTPHPAFQGIRLNAIWLLLARIITQAQLILFTILVARSLGVTGFGQYAFVAALIVVGNVATTFGTDTLLIREEARQRAVHDDAPLFARSAEGLIPSALLIQLMLSAAWLIFIGLGADILSGQSAEVSLALKISSLSLLPLAFFTVFTAVLRAHERMDVYFLLSGVVACVQLGGAWWVLHRDGNLLALVTVLNLVQVMAAISAGLLCRLTLPAFHFDWSVSRRHLFRVARLAWPFALLSVLAVIYQRLGILMLSTSNGAMQAGWFAAAARIIEPVKLLHFAVLGALLPALARLTADKATVQQNQAADIYRRSMLFLLMFSALAAAGLIALAQPIVMQLFGAAYVDAVPLVQILALSLIPYTFSASRSVQLVALGQERHVLWATAISLAVAFCLNGWLIPRFGVNGAAFTVVCSESVLATILFVSRR